MLQIYFFHLLRACFKFMQSSGEAITEQTAPESKRSRVQSREVRYVFAMHQALC